MQNNLADKAIQAALEGRWIEAVDCNLKIVQDEKNNIASLNRLGRAYTELGKIKEAISTYKKVLDIDKYNPIAKKNLKRLKVKKLTTTTNKGSPPTPPLHANFLEEPGKTKSSQLVRLADADIIANLQIGQLLTLEARKRTVCVKNKDGTYIGSLPDDLSIRLGKLIRAGNKYEALVKGLESHSVQIFIRETYRSSRLKNTPSFPTTSTTSYYADIRHALLEEEPINTRETGED